jgi:hypothetical protein
MDKLKSFIENARGKGYDDERIKVALLKAGWSAARVDEALAANKPSPAVQVPVSQATSVPVQRSGAVAPLQPTNKVDDVNVNLENLNIDSDKPAATAQAKQPAADKKPLLKRLLPKVAAAVILIAGLSVVIYGFKAYSHTRVPGGFAITRGQIAFSIPGKKGQYDTRVNFKTPDGGNHSFVTPTPPGDNNTSKYVAGDGMKVGYYPQNPDMTALDLTDRGSPLAGIIMLAAGAVITVIGTFFLFRQFRRKDQL